MHCESDTVLKAVGYTAFTRIYVLKVAEVHDVNVVRLVVDKNIESGPLVFPVEVAGL